MRHSIGAKAFYSLVVEVKFVNLIVTPHLPNVRKEKIRDKAQVVYNA